MGIFEDIVSPVENAFKSIVKGVEVPIHVIESIFGTVIKVTEEFITSVLNMIEDLRNLFNASNVEILFLSPFKDAALSVVGSVDKLYNLITQASAPTAEGVKEELMVPINAVYSKMKSGMNDMVGKLGNLLTRLQTEGQRVMHSIMEDFHRIKALLETFPVEIGILKRKIASEIKVVGADAFSIVQDIPEMIERDGANAFHAVKKKGDVVGADFTNFESSLKRRFTNENAALDLFYLVLIGGIIAVFIAIFMVTKSIALIVNILVIVLIALVLYGVTEFLLGVV